MIPLNNIPPWMEKYIPMLTGGICKNESELRTNLDVIASTHPMKEAATMIAVSQLNAKIELLTQLEKSHLI